MPVESRRSVCAACLPRAQMTKGLIISSCLIRIGSHALISSGCGSRLFGGRHFTTLHMKTSSLFNPISERSFSKSLPALPTKGIPCKSSCCPGASPTKTSLALVAPSPGTVFVRFSQSLHFLHIATSSAMMRKASRESSCSNVFLNFVVK